MEQEDVERILNQPQLIHRLFSAKDGQCSAFLEQMQQLDRLYFSQEKPDHTEYRLSVALVQVWLELLCLLPQEELHPVKADPRHERIRRMLSFCIPIMLNRFRWSKLHKRLMSAGASASVASTAVWGKLLMLI